MAETNIPTQIHPQLRVVDNPYLKVRVDVKDHENIINQQLDTWSRSVTFNTFTYDDGRRWVGLANNNSNSSGDLTKTINLPRSCHYLIYISTDSQPTYNGGFQLYDGTTAIEEFKSLNSQWGHTSFIQYKPRYYSSGNHNFKISLNKSGFVGVIHIIPLFRFEGDNRENNYRNKYRLDFSGCEFTQNSVNELNGLTLDMGMNEKYYADYDYGNSILKFHYSDHATIWLGNTAKNTRTMWGGYITGYEIDDEDLTLTGYDRMHDLDRQPIFRNFSIAGGNTENTNNEPFIFFSNVYELARYLATVSDYSIPPFTVPYEYGFFKNMGDTGAYNSISVTGWEKAWDTQHGNPKPSLKIYVGSGTGASTAIVYQNNENPYDATVYERFSFDYYFSGSTARSLLSFNVKFTVHNTNETISDAEIFNVHFTGAGGENNTIGSIVPIKNGEFQRFQINLKDLLNNYHSPSQNSSNYYVPKIEFSGTIDDVETGKRSCSAVWVDNIGSYKEINHAPKYASQDVKTFYEELKQVCENTQHSAYVEYGDSRAEDTLVVVPENWTTSTAIIDEGNNLVEFGGYEYKPLDDDFGNSRHITYNDTNNNYHQSTYSDYDIQSHYGINKSHKFMDDIDNQSDADLQAKNWVTNYKHPRAGFTLNILGDGGLLPLQYCNVQLPRRRIVGDYQIKSITHTYDQDNSPKYITKVDFGRSSSRFRNWILTTRSDLKNLGTRNAQTIYKNSASERLGIAGYGAFSQ